MNQLIEFLKLYINSMLHAKHLIIVQLNKGLRVLQEQR